MKECSAAAVLGSGEVRGQRSEMMYACSIPLIKWAGLTFSFVVSAKFVHILQQHNTWVGREGWGGGGRQGEGGRRGGGEEEREEGRGREAGMSNESEGVTGRVRGCHSGSGWQLTFGQIVSELSFCSSH